MDIAKMRSIMMRNIEEYHRRIFILEGEAHSFLSDIISLYISVRKSGFSMLISGKENRENSGLLSTILDEIKEYVDMNIIHWGYVPFKNLERIMGSTWDFLIVDFREDLRPNDLGRLIEVVRGGGIIIFLSPKRSIWRVMMTSFHRDMVTKPFKDEDLKPIFLNHLVSTLESSPGIFFIDESGNILGKDASSVPPEKSTPKIPSDISFDREIYDVCLTQDQANVIYAIDKLSEKGGSTVIIADRGRGKSASLGLAIAGLLFKTSGEKREPMKIVLTAPDPINIKEVFNFIIRILHRKKIRFTTRKRNGVIVDIECEMGRVRYLSPIEVSRSKVDLVVVDEASGIPVNLLVEYAEKYSFTIFSTTLHGYEGVGRGFQIRFLPHLKKLRGDDDLIELHMTNPIRYSESDPIEKWLFKALFLDSDPAELPDEELVKILPERTRYVKMDLEKWLFNKEDKLREYIGIYVYAHYRNRPNDIMILCDAPHHFARCLTYKENVVNSLHLSIEGKMDIDDIRKTLSGEPPSGHLIPTVIIRYYPSFMEFAELEGVRIVRIATHPQLMNRGIGSKALDDVVKEFSQDKYDWIGSSFGATNQLLNFWVKNGFYPIYLSPIRNPISGEFSTIVIKPISSRTIDIMKKLRIEFKQLFLETLVDSHLVLDGELAYILLSSDMESISSNPILSDAQKGRLKEYIYGALHYGGAYDVIRELVKTHFMRSMDQRVPIPIEYEYALISKVLQAKSWEKVSRELRIDRMSLIHRFREYIGKMRLNYVEDL